MILYVENPKESTTKPLRLVQLGKVRLKKSLVFLDASNERLKRKSKTPLQEHQIYKYSGMKLGRDEQALHRRPQECRGEVLYPWTRRAGAVSSPESDLYIQHSPNQNTKSFFLVKVDNKIYMEIQRN